LRSFTIALAGHPADSPSAMAKKTDDSPALPLEETCDRAIEAIYTRRWGGPIAGVDEVGRGPWAGPVVVAAVILPDDCEIDGLNDSKQLDRNQREALYELICDRALVAVASGSPTLIDRLNIRGATLNAMARAISALGMRPAGALFDGKDVPPGIACPGAAVVRGDARCSAIAAASIVAKVTRDRMMTAHSRHFPGYGFENHVGYGTPEHQRSLAQLGPCGIHRRSWAPIRALLEGVTIEVSAEDELQFA
jgi:ribonuclease HII